MINVYSANETNFNHNGLATLNPLSTDFSVEVNGNWVLTLVLPWDREKKYTYVEKNNIIIADINCIREQASKRQKFRIYDYKKNYNTITVKACPVAFEATFDVPITNLSLVGENGKISGVEAVSRIQDYVDDVAGKYTITTDVTKTAKADYTNSNLIKAIASSDDNSFINTWGGEVAYDNYDIKIKNALGDQDNASAYPIVYGKNITGVEYGIDVSNVVTRIYPISSDDMRLNAWDDLDATGKSTQQYVDGNTSAYPYTRSAFLVVDRAELIDTNSKSISDTRTHTLAWQNGIINKVTSVAKTLWQEVKKNEDQRFSPEYVQDLIPDIVNYVQARYTFSHKGWQSFIKSCIKQGIEWIKDEELAEWGWKGDYGAWWYGENSEVYAHDQYVLINKVYEYFNDEGYWQDWCRFTDADWHQTSDGTWWYGNKNADGSTKNYAVSQYIYIYSESKWYEFDGDGLYIDEEIPAETIALLNTYTWREDSTGWYYGDGNGNYLTNSWVESSEGRHYWVGADGYMDETKTDEQSWMWFTEPAKYRYGDYERYYAHNEYVYMTVDGQMKEWWYDKEGWYDEDKSGDSDFAWHGDGSASNPYWFGEEDAGTEDKNKYIHDKWAFIDGTYYWFDEYGYISGDASKAKQNYQWGVQTDTVTGDTWFGNPDRTYEAIYVKNQWLKIDGEWYYFGSDGYKVNMDEKKSEIIAWFGDEIYDETHGYIDGCLEEAYTYLYADMTAWANEQFTNGIDAPAVTVNVSLVDLSKTTEYKNYASFERICLGDKVEVKALGMSFTERVVGLTYDVIRGYNTSVTIGKMGDTISSLMSTSFGSVESGGTARLIGGDGVKVDGNVISSENVAVTYGIQDATLEGVSIVRGNVAQLNRIYRELTQSQYNALSSQEKNSGKLFYITDTQTIMHKNVAYGGGSISYGTSTPTGGSDGDVYFQTDSNGNIVKIWQNHSGVWGSMTGGGLEYWIEQQRAFKREEVIDVGEAGWTCDEEYKVGWFQATINNRATKKNSNVACGGLFAHRVNENNYRYYVCMISPVYADTIYDILYYNTPIAQSFEVGGATLYYCIHTRIEGFGYSTTGNEPSVTYAEGSDTLPWLGKFDTDEEVVNYLMEVSHFRTNEINGVGLGIDDYLFWGGHTGTVGTDMPQPSDFPVNVSKEGIYNAKDYRIDGVSIDKVRDVTVNGVSVVSDKVANIDLSGKQDTLIAGQNITIGADGKTISAHENMAGETIPVSSEGNNNAIYMQYSTTGGETGYETIWTGSVSTSAWASPVQIGTINPSEYYRIKITGTGSGERLVSEIPVVGSGDLWHLGHEMYIFTANDCTELWLYSSTGYSNTVTKVEATTYDEGIVDSIEKVYGKIKDDWYEIATGGGGGSEVIPNPQGTATDTLNTVGIDGTIFDLPSGGGGGSGLNVSVTKILDQHIASTGNFAIDDSIDKYDALLIGGYNYVSSSYSNQYKTTLILKEDYYKNTSNHADHILGNMTASTSGDNPRRVIFYFPDDTHINIQTRNYASIDKIFGLKFEQGGSGATFEGLDYSNATDLTLPDNTGYIYTPSEDGVIMVTAYGNVGALSIQQDNFEAIHLAHGSDRWTTAWCFVEKGVNYTLSSTSRSNSWPSGSWAKFIPLKQSSSGGGGSSEVNYSTDEQKIGTWIDGKPLYQKTVEVTSITRSAWNSYLVDADAVIKNIEGWYGDANNRLPLNYFTGSVMLNRTSDHADGYFSLYGSGTISTATVTVRYTKTTD